jgi:hypothetical protein
MHLVRDYQFIIVQMDHSYGQNLAGAVVRGVLYSQNSRRQRRGERGGGGENQMTAGLLGVLVQPAACSFWLVADGCADLF